MLFKQDTEFFFLNNLYEKKKKTLSFINSLWLLVWFDEEESERKIQSFIIGTIFFKNFNQMNKIKIFQKKKKSNQILCVYITRVYFLRSSKWFICTLRRKFILESNHRHTETATTSEKSDIANGDDDLSTMNRERKTFNLELWKVICLFFIFFLLFLLLLLSVDHQILSW